MITYTILGFPCYNYRDYRLIYPPKPYFNYYAPCTIEPSYKSPLDPFKGTLSRNPNYSSY